MSTPLRSHAQSAPAYQPTALPAGIGRVAQQLTTSIPDLTEADRQFLHDLARDERRYAWKALGRLLTLAARSTRPDHRLALSELLRGAVQSRRATTADVAAAFDAETAAQGPADVAQREFERHPSAATKARCEDALLTEFDAARAAIDAVHSAPI